MIATYAKLPIGFFAILLCSYAKGDVRQLDSVESNFSSLHERHLIREGCSGDVSRFEKL